jgi:hypothetical protein
MHGYRLRLVNNLLYSLWCSLELANNHIICVRFLRKTQISVLQKCKCHNTKFTTTHNCLEDTNFSWFKYLGWTSFSCYLKLKRCCINLWNDEKHLKVRWWKLLFVYTNDCDSDMDVPYSPFYTYFYFHLLLAYECVSQRLQAILDAWLLTTIS